jgi:hypothetical protein
MPTRERGKLSNKAGLSIFDRMLRYSCDHRSPTTAGSANMLNCRPEGVQSKGCLSHCTRDVSYFAGENSYHHSSAARPNQIEGSPCLRTSRRRAAQGRSRTGPVQSVGVGDRDAPDAHDTDDLLDATSIRPRVPRRMLLRRPVVRGNASGARVSSASAVT